MFWKKKENNLIYHNIMKYQMIKLYTLLGFLYGDMNNLPAVILKEIKKVM
jgi:hypothetical protein